MKPKNKNLLFFLVFLTILMISVPSLYTRKSRDETDIFNLGNSQVSWDVSDYVEFTGPPIDTSPPYYLAVYRIFIDETNPNYTWSKTESENEWCSGLGTEGDPYKIEGLYINAQGIGGCILIDNSNNYFIIKNCWFNYSGMNHNFDAGVMLENTTNGIIENCIFSYVCGGVMMQFYCSDITISGNYLVSDHTTAGFGRAFDLVYFSNNIIITGNKVWNFREGMYVGRAYNCIIKDNYFKNTIWGEDFDDHCIFITRTNNSQIIYNNFDGVYSNVSNIVVEFDCSDNTITDNRKQPGAKSLPIPLVSTYTNKLTTSESYEGLIDIRRSHNNLIAHNRQFVPGSGQLIPGYEVWIVTGLISISSISIILRKGRIAKKNIL